MRQPIAVEVRAGAGYVRYTEVRVVRTIDVTPSCSVAADIDANDDVVGIEVLDIAAPEQLTAAARFAKERGLAFPRDLAGALSASA